MILLGTVLCRLTGADPGATLLAINRRGILVTGLIQEDELTVRFRCGKAHRRTVERICAARGDDLRISDEKGIGVICRRVLARPVLLAGCILLLLLTMYLPTRVLFLTVEGNARIPGRQILAAAESCGIRFGASRRQVRSEKMKNALLCAMPELKWAGINTTGCTAVISVRERDPEPEKPEPRVFSGIAACRDGFITSCTVVKGNALCAPGQTVKKGQMLISGLTDCGICIRVTAAEGEVFAQTRRNLRLKQPDSRLVRTEEGEADRRFSLLLGKKRINFWKGSGISHSSCGRMYEEYYITLPGGFRLPLGIGVETLFSWKTAPETPDPDADRAAMENWAVTLVQKEMVAGKILHRDFRLTEEGILLARFVCEEMIGRVITEEIGEANGKTD